MIYVVEESSERRKLSGPKTEMKLLGCPNELIGRAFGSEVSGRTERSDEKWHKLKEKKA